jgi:hypothetical protein
MTPEQQAMSNDGIPVTKIRELLNLSKELIPHFNEVEANTYVLVMKRIVENMEARNPEEGHEND